MDTSMDMIKKAAPFGTWNSPIAAEMIGRVEKSNRNCDILINEKGIYWTEPRPAEKGRTVILFQQENGTVSSLTPPDFDVRSKVHEYGGVAYTVVGDTLYFVNGKDQRIYKQLFNENPVPLTNEGTRFADLIPAPHGLIAIGEIHREEGVDNFLALINTLSGSYSILDQGQDFYAFPAISADGTQIAWLTWNHPRMPWDGTLLWTADFADGSLKNKKMVAGGIQESIYQPQWSPKGHLFFISDREGWWNLYRLADRTSKNICPMEAEFGLPLWRLGTSTWRFTGNEEQILCSYQEKGIGKLAFFDPENEKLEPLSLEYTDYSQITVGQGYALFLAGTSTESRKIIKMELISRSLSTIGPSEPLSIDPEYFSHPESIEFPSSNGRFSYGYFYAPQNKDYKGVSGSLPPLMIIGHGGPTAVSDRVFNLRIQYWTSRGFAILDVNYGGSTGYGRAYRERLKGQWGVLDVEDCIQGGLYLAKQNKVDVNKVVIRGASAGGFTTLEALCQSNIFAAAACYYGVTNLELLIRDTHKFEANYLDSLIGPYPERKDLYFERSPLHHSDKINCPVIFFQGGKDKVVPPNQSQALYEALQKRGVKSKLILYENEEHGFRQAETIRDSLEKELHFYLEVFYP